MGSWWLVTNPNDWKNWNGKVWPDENENSERD